MPWGSRPSMAALTRLGARNASEILMLTLRALHPSRLAMLSAVAFGMVVSSSSQRRPRAIDASRSSGRGIGAGFQKRKRNPAVGSMLLRWRKP
jgi:hypothetical protein